MYILTVISCTHRKYSGHGTLIVPMTALSPVKVLTSAIKVLFQHFRFKISTCSFLLSLHMSFVSYIELGISLQIFPCIFIFLADLTLKYW